MGITCIEIAQGKPPYYGNAEFDIMRKIKFDEPPSLKDPKKWDPCFVDFIKSCLIKDPAKRHTVDELLKINKKFFAKAKTKIFLVENLLKGVPNVQDRVKYIVFI